MNIEIGILNVLKHDNKHDLIHLVIKSMYFYITVLYKIGQTSDFAACFNFWAAFYSLKHENSILAEWYFTRG